MLLGPGCVWPLRGSPPDSEGVFRNKVSDYGNQTPIILGFLEGPEEALLGCSRGWSAGSEQPLLIAFPLPDDTLPHLPCGYVLDCQSGRVV